jgi:PAS domain S-box-containing protein
MDALMSLDAQPAARGGPPDSRVLAELPIGLAIFDTQPEPRCLWANAAFEAAVTGEARTDLAGKTLRDSATEPAFGQLLQAIQTAARGDGPTEIASMDGVGAPGSPVRCYRVDVRRLDGPGARVVVVSDDITDTARARRRIEGLAALSHQALVGAPLGRLVTDAVRLVADVVGVELAAFFALGASGPWLVAGVGWRRAQPTMAELQGLLRVIEITHGPTADPDDPGLPPLLRAHGVRSGVTLPVGDGDQGWLGIYTRGLREFDASDRNALRAVANLVAAAIVRQRADTELAFQARSLREAKEQLEAVLASASAGIAVQAPNGRFLYGNLAAARLTGRETVEDLLRPAPDVTERFEITAEDGSIMPIDELPGRRALRGEPQPDALLRLRDQVRDEERWLLIKARPLLESDGSVKAAVIVIEDQTEEKRSQALLAARAEQQALIAELGQRAMTGVDLDELMTAAADGARRMLGVEFAHVLERRPDGGFVARACPGWEPSISGTEFPPGRHSHAGRTVAKARPVILRNRAAVRRHQGDAPLRDAGIASGASVLIGDPNQPWGILAVHSRGLHDYAPQSISFLQAIANLIAAAIERSLVEDISRRQARLIEESRFEERTRLARDLHDGLAQDLWLTRLRYGLLVERLQLTEPEAAAADEVTRALDGAIATARAAVGAMRAGPSDSPDLGDAMRRSIDEIGERLGLETELVIQGRLPLLEPDTVAEILGIVREALNNAGKHAGTRVVRIVASGGPSALLITVADAGPGFDPSVSSVTFGLAGMRERAQLIGASLEIETHPGQGTTVRLRVPTATGAP